jgi:nucleotide-binding universal stress UspA family protein
MPKCLILLFVSNDAHDCEKRETSPQIELPWSYMMKSAIERSILRQSIVKPRPIRVRRVLVTTDFSRLSLVAIPYALAVARHFGAELHLFHVVDTTEFSSKSLLLPLISPAELSRPLLKRLQGIALKFSPDGRIHVMKPREGRAYNEICVSARKLHADLIVIATHGATGFQHLWLGSTAERVVQHSPCPVLVVRKPFQRFQEGRIRLRKILVPVDFSDCSQVAFDCGVGLAREFDSELLLVHVIDPICYPLGDEYGGVYSAGLMEEARAFAQSKLKKLTRNARVQCSIRIGEGSPAREICQLAKRDVDLIIAPTHGRTGLSHVLIGSVAERVVRYASCPVLVIPVRRKLKTGRVVFSSKSC